MANQSQALGGRQSTGTTSLSFAEETRADREFFAAMRELPVINSEAAALQYRRVLVARYPSLAQTFQALGYSL